ncbi:uncharacterized protein LOC117039131 [Lacerta agilis]|uniref:uncharacterized protein LOC117039131 n=1 Tax=Lacerta agilis TaxID=80427 RepID=UPI0014194063|nr:uncharacterized protein LOC117039131 [Lacerta agilis]
MTGSWLCLPLLLLSALLLGQPAWGAQEEEPGEELQQPESGGGGQWHCCRGAARELTSEERYEERASSNQRMLKDEEESQYLRDYFKTKITDYFNAQNPKHFYKLYEDAQLKIKDAPGFIMEFTVYMVKTNCTKDEEELPRQSLLRRGIRNHGYMDDDDDDESSEDLSGCHPLSGDDKEIQKCKFSMYFSGHGHHIVGHRCREVQIVEESED